MKVGCCVATLQTLVTEVFCVDFIATIYNVDVFLLERAKRRFTSILPGLKGISYGERLDRVTLFSLKQKSLRGDLIDYVEAQIGQRIKMISPRCG